MITLSFGEYKKQPEQLFTIELDDIISFMKTSEKLEWLIEDIRKAVEAGNKQLVKELKLDLQYIVPCHFLNPYRNEQNFEKSNLMIFDIDKISCDKLADLKNKLMQDPLILFCFKSPSGKGLKVGIKIKNMIYSANDYKENYEHYKTKFEKTYDVILDKTLSPVHGCYISHDLDLYYNPDSIPVLNYKKLKVVKIYRTVKTNNDDINQLIDMARCITINDYHEWIECGMALKTIEGGFEVFKALSLGKGFDDTEEQLYQKWQSFKSDGNTKIGTFYYYAKKYGSTWK